MSQLKNCIKVRVPTSDGWRDVRMERDIEGFYHAIDGYDFKLIEKANYDEVIPDYFFQTVQNIRQTLYWDITAASRLRSHGKATNGRKPRINREPASAGFLLAVQKL